LFYLSENSDKLNSLNSILQFIKDHPDKFTTDELKQYLLDNLIINFSALENGSSGNK